MSGPDGGVAARGTFFARVYDVVRRVPSGRVTTYGAVSRAVVGHARAARTVGWALHALPDPSAERVPWWRVINAAGRISSSGTGSAVAEQRARLEEEGIAFGADDRVDLGRHGWEPDWGVAEPGAR